MPSRQAGQADRVPRASHHADDANDPFLAWLFAEAGLRAGHYRPESLRRRLPACLRALRAETVEQARRMLRRNARLVPLAVDALLLGVTEFFRDASVFDEVKQRLGSMANACPPLRIWSAGCSDGSELYSVAMLCGELDALDRCELIGTDCRPDAIARSQSGVFKPASLRGLSHERMLRHFIIKPPHGRDATAVAWQVCDSIQRRITWRCADLMTQAEPGPWDVIFCRNLVMYLQPHAAERVWSMLAERLRPGGLLVVGKAERLPANIGLELVGPCIHRRRGGA